MLYSTHHLIGLSKPYHLCSFIKYIANRENGPKQLVQHLTIQQTMHKKNTKLSALAGEKK